MTSPSSLTPGGQEETFHICQRHQGADHAKDLRRTILRVHRREQGVGEEAEQILKLKPNQISGTAKKATDATRKRIQADAWRTGWKGSQTGVGHTNGLERVSRMRANGRSTTTTAHDTFEFQNVLSGQPARTRYGKICVESKAYQTFNQMIYYLKDS